MANTLQEIDALEILVIVDNELDPITPSMNPAVQLEGGLKEIGLGSLFPAPGRGDCSKELRMEGICCGAHGLSLMIVRCHHPVSGVMCVTDRADRDQGRRAEDCAV